MTRDEFLAWASAVGIPLDAFALDGGHPSESFVIDRRGSVWLVYYSERGLETESRLFATEGEALSELQRRLVPVKSD